MTKNNFWAIIAGILGLFVVTVIMSWAMNVNEVNECQAWLDQSRQFPGFYLTEWQKNQCDSHLIFINARVR